MSRNNETELGGYTFWTDCAELGPERFQGRVHVVKLPNTTVRMEEPVTLHLSKICKYRVDAPVEAHAHAVYLIKVDAMRDALFGARQRRH